MSLVQNLESRDRGGWSRASLAYLEKVKQVLVSLKEYWPLTLRQVYYRLVAAGTIENNLAEYSKLSRILTKARLDGLVSWESMEDRSRRMLLSAGWEDKDDFDNVVTRGNVHHKWCRENSESPNTFSQLHR